MTICQPPGIPGALPDEADAEAPDSPALLRDNETATSGSAGGATSKSGSAGWRQRIPRFPGQSGRRDKDLESKQRIPIVALVSDAIFPYHCGGREIRYHELIQRLSDRAELHVYTMRWWDGPGVREDGNVTLHGISRRHRMYTHNRRSLRQAIFFALGCMRLLVTRFDVLEADHMPLLQILVLRLVTTVKRKRFVVTWHEVWGPAYWRQYLGRVGFIAAFVEYLAMRVPDHIIAASTYTADRLRAGLGARASITVAPNGIDLEAVRTSDPHHETADLVVVSRLMPHKRISMLLDTVALLHTEGHYVTCRIIGDGPERDDLRQHAQVLGIADAVEFRHDVREQKEVYQLLKAAKVFVFPSAREGFGIAVLEALACGLPVVTTSTPDNLAQHLVARSANGTICESTPAAIADAVRPLLARAASPDGRPSADDDLWLSEYNWDTMVDRVITALQI